MTEFKIFLILAFTAFAQALYSQTPKTASANVWERPEQVIKDFLTESSVRLDNAQGRGVHHAWMDQLRERGIKRVVVCVDIAFDKHGRPKEMNVASIHYFPEYEGGAEILASERLSEIRTSNLEKQLNDTALDEAKHSYWIDVPRPRPKPFVGAVKVVLLDDESLPAGPGLYTTSRVCP